MKKIGPDQIHSELLEYARLSCDETGEVAAILCDCYGRRDYFSDEFSKAILKEMVDTYMMFKERTRKVKRTITETHTVEELEWI